MPPLSCPTPQVAFNYPSLFNDSRNAESESPWTCSACTFQNHPLLLRCEECEAARIPSGTVSPSTYGVQASSQYQRSASSPTYYQQNGTTAYSPATPFSPALYPVQYAPSFPYSATTHNLHPELTLPVNDNNSINSSNNSQSVGDLPGAIRAVFKKGHRQTPSM